MFWRFGGYSNISTIDTLLDKQDVTLEDLLDESDLIQELKSHNTKLIEYLRDEAVLDKLLKYVIAPGPPIDDEAGEDDVVATEKTKGKASEAKAAEDARKSNEEKEKAEKKRVKYSYVACEILSCETWSITEALMSNVPHLTEFWDFLRRSPPLDPLQAGYFTKVNETLLEKKTEDMLEFFKSLPGIVPAILQHVDCPMVMDLLLKIISLEKAEGGQGIVDWLHTQDLIPTLLSYLSPDCNSSTQTSAGDFLKAIITISANAAQNEQSCIGPNSLTRQLVSESCMQHLISSMLKGGNPLTVGVGIVIEVIRKNNSDYDPENGHNPDTPPTTHDPIYLGTLLRMFAKHVPDFMALILSSRHTVTEGESTKVVERGRLNSAWGTTIEPLGFDRFKTCELMAELLHCSNMGLLNERGSEEFIKERDAERERLRTQGSFFAQKQSEDSTIDLSTTSSRFENGFTPSTGASTDDLRIANSFDDDGFEKVMVSETTDDRDMETAPDFSGSVIHHKSEQDKEQNEILDFIEAPLSPSHRRKVQDSTESPEPTSPRSTKLNDKVRRLSIGDVTMTSPPNETYDSPSAKSFGESSPISPHPDDKPAPLFSKSSDPNKTPTPASPNPPNSPRSPKLQKEDSSLVSQMEGDSFAVAEDNTQSYETLDADGEIPVVGDYLKIMFVENQVVPTILSFFFRFPWNNFLHNVVYDVVQQVFNGPMDRGHNRFLAFDLFETGRITEQIIEGQRASDEAQKTKNMRLGYMGHLTLVAEEVVKFGERQPKEVLSPKVQDYVYGKEWDEYVTKTLADTRDRDNAILGGFRPESGLGPRQAVLNAVNSGQGLGNSSALASAGLGGGFQHGLDSIDISNNGSATSGLHSTGGSLVSGFGSSSDDEDEDMDDSEDDDHQRTAIQLSAADTGLSLDDSEQPIPLIPPPPPLSIKPSQARQRLATRLAMQKQLAEEEATGSELGPDAEDPFASLGDPDDQDPSDPFALDEDEQDITSFGNRNNASIFHHNSSSDNQHPLFVSRGLPGLFSSGRRSRHHETPDDFDASLDDSSSDGSGSDMDQEHPPLEAKTSNERRPLDIDDEDEEMGEMVAPTEESSGGASSTSSSDEEEAALSPQERAKLSFGGTAPAPRVDMIMQEDDESVSEFEGQQDHVGGDSSDEEGEELVQIALPGSARRSSIT